MLLKKMLIMLKIVSFNFNDVERNILHVLNHSDVNIFSCGRQKRSIIPGLIKR